MNLTGPASAVVVSIVVTGGILFGVGTFTLAEKNYATVNFEGGYERIGVIRRESIFSEVNIRMGGDNLTEGSIEEVTDWLESNLSTDGSLDGIELKTGVTVDIEAGIEWQASESNFKLVTDSETLVSTVENQLTPLAIISRMNTIKNDATADRVITSTKSLQFGRAPKESFLISRLINAFAD